MGEEYMRYGLEIWMNANRRRGDTLYPTDLLWLQWVVITRAEQNSVQIEKSNRIELIMFNRFDFKI